ncbi:MAG: MFS transporter [Pseudomonadota bacterium]
MQFVTFIANNLRWLLGGFLLTFCSAFGQTFFIALSAGDIRAEYGLSHGEFGNLYMLATLGSALTLPWIGKIVDRYSAAQVTLMIVPLLALACVGMALSASIITLVVVIYMLRLFGQGLMTQNALTATGRWFAANRGRAVSLVTLGYNASEALLPFVFVALFAWFGWRSGWLIAASALLIIALPVIYAFLREERQPNSVEVHETRLAVREWTRALVLRDPIFWILLTGTLAPPFIGTTIFFHQVYLVEIRGWALETFALSFSLMAAMTICFALISGALIDRFSAVRLLPTFLIPLAFSCLVLSVFDEIWSAFAFMALMGVSYGFSSTLFGALWPEVYGTRHLGSIRAVVVAIMVFATAAGPGITGTLIDIGIDYPTQIGVMGFYCICVCVVMTFASRQLRLRLESQLANNAATE